MSMYVPEIVEEVSENAKMLVEDNGKIVRTAVPSGGNLKPIIFRDKSGFGDSWLSYDEDSATKPATFDMILNAFNENRCIMIHHFGTSYTSMINGVVFSEKNNPNIDNIVGFIYLSNKDGKKYIINNDDDCSIAEYSA